MTTKKKTALVFLAFSLIAAGVQGGRKEFSYAVGLPSKKQPIEVLIRRNPFQAGSEIERPLPMLRDKDDPATRLPVVLAGRIRSVIRGPRPLLLIDGLVLQPGDEVHPGRDALLPNHRVVLKTIEDDRLVFHLTSLDPQQPGQVEVVIMLAAGMRKN